MEKVSIYDWEGLGQMLTLIFLDEAIMDHVNFFPMLFVLFYLNSFLLFNMGC